MALSNAERQAKWRARHQGADKARIAELEAEVAKLKNASTSKLALHNEGNPKGQLPGSAQKKIDAAIRQATRKLEAEFEQRLQGALAEALNDTVLPQYNKEIEQARLVTASRKGVLTRSEYRLLRSTAHPDN
jgi:hypothetical protein